MNNNTAKSFHDKWHQNKDLAFQNTLKEGSEVQNWILHRNGWKSLQELKAFLTGKKRILDAGCGNGRITALLAMNAPTEAKVTGIDLTAADVAAENLRDIKNTSFYTKDLLADNSDIGKFDFIYCQEVLHHTDNPELGFRNLVKNNLDDNGTIAIYVYKKKAPVREYVDDFIRDRIKDLPYDEAIKACGQITELGKVLSELNVKVKIPAVDVLKIEEGEYDVQRFIYHYFMKCFWAADMNFEDNTVINYDWYHPQNCERYEVTEIRKWFNDLQMEITHEFVDPYGITMHGCKK